MFQQAPTPTALRSAHVVSPTAPESGTASKPNSYYKAINYYSPVTPVYYSPVHWIYGVHHIPIAGNGGTTEGPSWVVERWTEWCFVPKYGVHCTSGE